MDTICDTCRALHQLNETYNKRLGRVSLLSVRPALDAGQIGILNCFVNSLHHRVCTCCFLQLRQYDLLNNVVQALLQTFIEQTNLLPARQWSERRPSGSSEVPAVEQEPSSPAATTSCPSGEVASTSYSSEQLQLLFQLTAKVLQPQFAPYLAYKQAVEEQEDDSEEEEQGTRGGGQDSALAASVLYRLYCDVSDPDVSEYTLRNVCYLCEHGAPAAITAVFRSAGPGTHTAGLPPTLAHALVVVAVNLKMWMAGAAGTELMAPLRPAVIGYMCQLSEAELKSSAVRSLSDFMWSSVRGGGGVGGASVVDTATTSSGSGHGQFLDEDGLSLALKFFASSTLTVRLAGIAHINSNVALYSELMTAVSHTDTPEIPAAAVVARDPGSLLADWLVHNRLVEHMYGPNLHVEIVKQSPIVLNFLAVEGRLTNEHIELIFQATQLKHCGKQVYDILAPLIKNLEPQSILYLYRLLQKMEPKDHTEQSLYLASVLIKFVWNCSAIAAATSSNEPIHSPVLPSRSVDGGRVVGCLPAVMSVDDDDGIGNDDEDSCSAQPSDDDDGHQRHRQIHLLDKQLDDMVRLQRKTIEVVEGNSPGSSKHDEDNCDAAESCLSRRQSSPSFKDCGGCVTSPTDDGCMVGRSSPVLIVSPVYGSRKRSIPALQSADSVVFPSAGLLTAEGTSGGRDTRQSLSTDAVDSGTPRRPVADDGGLCGEGSPAKRVCRSSPVNYCDDQASVLSPDVLNSRRRVFLSNSCRQLQLLPSSPASSQLSSPGSPAAARTADSHRGFDDRRDCHGQQLELNTVEDHKLSREQLRTIALHHPGEACASDDAETSSSCSRMSVHSDKQLTDFIGVDPASPGSLQKTGGYDDELMQLALQAASCQLPQHLASMATMYQRQFGSEPPTLSRPPATHTPSRQLIGAGGGADQLHVFARFGAENVCRPGQTLLWDLLQDERIGELGDGVAVECERVLTHLLCHSASASVRRCFVAGCLDHLACQRSVIVVLRLLPKLLASFDQLTGGGTHQVTIWAEEVHSMMERFFSNLQQEALNRCCHPNSADIDTDTTSNSGRRSGQLPVTGRCDGRSATSGGNSCSATTSGCDSSAVKSCEEVGVFSLAEVQIRLDFLSAVFSSLGSPEQFRLSVEQVDMLWACLADVSLSAADALFTWMLSQVCSNGQHALGANSLRHLLTVKLPSLSADRTSMKALRLYQQLRLSYSMVSSGPAAAQSVGLSPLTTDADYLWSIALRATDTDVALSSIEYLNSCYVSGSAERERQFIERCMAELGSACEELSSSTLSSGGDGEERCLLRIQRGLQLLSRHLQTYKKRFAYHLRRWLLCGRGVVSHAQTVGSSSLLMSTPGHRYHPHSPVQQPPSSPSPTDAGGGVGGPGAGRCSPVTETRLRSCCGRAACGGMSATAVAVSGDQEDQTPLLHVLLQSVGGTGGDDRRMVRLAGTSYLAELRAEAHYHWLHVLHDSQCRPGHCHAGEEGGEWAAVSAVRLITQDLELSSDRDESTLSELGFKDMQVIYTSMAGIRPFQHMVGPRGKDDGGAAGVQFGAPSRDSVPMLLLLQEQYFDQLLLLMQQLASLKTASGGTHYKGQVLSRSVWSILLALPTAPRLYQLFSQLPPTLSSPSAGTSTLCQLLDPESPQKLLYALYLVSHLCNTTDENDGDASVMGHDGLQWSRRFSDAGGLSHLNSILMSGTLQSVDGSWSVDEWRQDCLICILHVIVQLATVGPEDPDLPEPISSGDGRSPTSPQHSSGRKKMRCRRGSHEKIRLNQAALATLNVSDMIDRLCSILYTMVRHQRSNLQLKTGISSRAQLVQHVFSLMFALCGSCAEEASSALFANSLYRRWLRALLLEEPEPSVRWEIADGLIRLCLYCTKPASGDSEGVCLFLFPILCDLVALLPVAESLGTTVLPSTDSVRDSDQAMNHIEDSNEKASDEQFDISTCLSSSSPPRHKGSAIEPSETKSDTKSVPSASSGTSGDPSQASPSNPSETSPDALVKSAKSERSAKPPNPSEISAPSSTSEASETSINPSEISPNPSATSATPASRAEPSISTVAPPMMADTQQMCYLGKVWYGPSCCQYFWLVARLLEQSAGREPADSSGGQRQWLLELAARLASALERRSAACQRGDHHQYHQQRSDPGLVGLLRLLTVTVRNLAKDSAQNSLDTVQSTKLLDQVFEYVFALPTAHCRSLPLCRWSEARAAGLDLLVELVTGCSSCFHQLLRRLQTLVQRPAHHVAGGGFPWDYWPQDDGRSECGYVGLTNLGATCYMASCMQHLFMMPLARASILEASVDDKCQHETTLQELQRMFAYLMEGERKAYNPRNFCNVYTMDHRPLNTGDQKDMAEFFIDLVSKLEDMSPSLCAIVKQLFCGQISNNVVSLDCVHVSRTCEEFYTVRCQVADMRSLDHSLDELTVKDTLEGDNMYTCSQCQKKVRAEKRACFKKLPHILCFNTMRYTFNMNTMLREKVNTLFSFPLHLDMSRYLEETLMPDSRRQVDDEQPEDDTPSDSCLYELIGVTVHTGTAEGGHYYSFIRDRGATSTPTSLTNEASTLTADSGEGGGEGGNRCSSGEGGEVWLLFNDAEVKPFDSSQLPGECFGGETTSKTYDSISDKFLDFSFEKTNSAYMLFYERFSNPTKKKETKGSSETVAEAGSCGFRPPGVASEQQKVRLRSELEQWVWKDNMEFLMDKNLFDHSFFTFMWQVCGYIPQTLSPSDELTLITTRLSTTFFLEVFIHAKEKPTMVQWVKLLTKQFNTSQMACEWFLDHMAGDCWWPVNILIKCGNQMVRQMFHRLCIHVIQRIRHSHCHLYLSRDLPSDHDTSSDDPELPGESATTGTGGQQGGATSPQTTHVSCVTRFVNTLFSLLDNVAKLHVRNLGEYFSFLLEFARMGCAEINCLLSLNAVSSLVNFYFSQLPDANEDLSEGEDDEELLDVGPSLECRSGADSAASGAGGVRGATSGGANKLRTVCLERLVALVTLLVEHGGRGTAGGDGGGDGVVALSTTDLLTLIGGRNLPFVCNLVRDGVCVRPLCVLLLAMCRACDSSRHQLRREQLAEELLAALFQAVVKYVESSQSFFRLISLLIESDGLSSPSCSPSSTTSSSSSSSSSPPVSSRASQFPSFTQLSLPHVWTTAEQLPHATLEWLSQLVATSTSRQLRAHVIGQLDSWCQRYLLAHAQFRVRAAASHLLVSLVPSAQFRLAFAQRSCPSSDISLSTESAAVLHQVYVYLLRLLRPARNYTDVQQHGTMKLVQYFQLLQCCVVSRTEKLQFGPYTGDLWTLLYPKLSEPPVAVHHNKQALFNFWHRVCSGCPQNVRLILASPNIVKNIAFNYILADHDDDHVVLYNRASLPVYYSLLRLCCLQSRQFTRRLASHQNIQWAFKNIALYPGQYSTTVDELFKLMKLFVTVHPDSDDSEVRDIVTFKRQTLQMFVQVIDPRCGWSSLNTALKLLANQQSERLLAIYSGLLKLLAETLDILHAMHHEPGSSSSSAGFTAAQLLPELNQLVFQLAETLACCKTFRNTKEMRQAIASFKDGQEMVRKLATLLNGFSPADLRLSCIDALKDLVVIQPRSSLSILVPFMLHAHSSYHQLPAGSCNRLLHLPLCQPTGQAPVLGPRAPRPLLQMSVPKRLELTNADQSSLVLEPDPDLLDTFLPYHLLCDLMCRVAVNSQLLTEPLVRLSALLAVEAVPLQLPHFAKFWIDVHLTKSMKSHVTLMLQCCYVEEYMKLVLTLARPSLCNSVIYKFFTLFLHKVPSVWSETPPSTSDYDPVDDIDMDEQEIGDPVSIPDRSVMSSVPLIIGQVKRDLQAVASGFGSGHDRSSLTARVLGDLRAIHLLASCVIPQSADTGTKWRHLLLHSLQLAEARLRQHLLPTSSSSHQPSSCSCQEQQRACTPSTPSYTCSCQERQLPRTPPPAPSSCQESNQPKTRSSPPYRDSQQPLTLSSPPCKDGHKPVTPSSPPCRHQEGDLPSVSSTPVCSRFSTCCCRESPSLADSALSTDCRCTTHQTLVSGDGVCRKNAVVCSSPRPEQGTSSVSEEVDRVTADGEPDDVIIARDESVPQPAADPTPRSPVARPVSDSHSPTYPSTESASVSDSHLEHTVSDCVHASTPEVAVGGVFSTSTAEESRLARLLHLVQHLALLLQNSETSSDE